MGERGPTPRPIALQDNPGALAAIEANLNQLTVLPPPPPFLEDTAYAPDAWDEVGNLLIGAKLLYSVDLPALACLALAMATVRLAQETINDVGLLTVGRFGSTVANPTVAIRDRAMADVRAWSVRFGLTPSDRAGLGLQVLGGAKAARELEDPLGESPRARGPKPAVIDYDPEES